MDREAILAMQIRVMLFAILKDAAGTSAVVLELPEGATAGDVRVPLIERYPLLAQYIPRVAFAVNQTYASIDAKLNGGDEVALIPPVSGGGDVYAK